MVEMDRLLVNFDAALVKEPVTMSDKLEHRAVFLDYAKTPEKVRHPLENANILCCHRNEC